MTTVTFVFGKVSSAPPSPYRDRGPYVFRPSSPGLAWRLRYRLKVKKFEIVRRGIDLTARASWRFLNACVNRQDRVRFPHTTRL